MNELSTLHCNNVYHGPDDEKEDGICTVINYIVLDWENKSTAEKCLSYMKLIVLHVIKNGDSEKIFQDDCWPLIDNCKPTLVLMKNLLFFFLEREQFFKGETQHIIKTSL